MAIENMQQATVDMAINGIRIVSKTIGSVTFVGVGLDDMTNGGEYTGTEDKTYLVKIDGTGTPDTIQWSDDGGTSWNFEDVDITGSDQSLTDGVTIKFNATTGHTLADQWSFEVKASDPQSMQKTVEQIISTSLAASGDVESSIVDCRKIEKLALTIKCDFHADAVAGVLVEIFTSFDGINFDTEAWASTGLDPTLDAGETVQKTSNIDTLPAYIKVKITNLEAVEGLANLISNVTKTEG